MPQSSLVWVPVPVQRGRDIRGIKRDNVAHTHTFRPRSTVWPKRFKADETPVIETDHRQQISDTCLLADKHVDVALSRSAPNLQKL